MRRGVVFAMAVVGCLLLVAGCGGSGTTSASKSLSSATTIKVGAPQYGGTLKIVISPLVGDFGYPVSVMGQALGNTQGCFETLLRSDAKGGLHPWLAESYEIASDLGSITFHLRKGVKFHDGSDFNADSAKWSLEQYIASGSEPLWASVDKVDEYTIRVHFGTHAAAAASGGATTTASTGAGTWKNSLPSTFSDNSFEAYMLSKSAYDTHGAEWMKQNPIGTGPFEFVSYQMGVSLKFKKNPNYWQKGKPYLDAVEYTFANDAMTIRNMAASGQVDLAVVDSGSALAQYKTLDMNQTPYSSGTVSLFPDTADANSPWANEKVRQAIEYAIDRESIAKNLGFGQWKATYQLPPRGTATYSDNFTLARKYNPEKAKQLLADAGYAGGFSTTIIVPPSTSQDVALAVQNDLAKVGIKVKIESVDVAKFVTFMGKGTWDKNAALFISHGCMNTTYTDGIQFLLNQIGASWAHPPELAQLLNDALSTTTVNIDKARACTDYITEHALLIPVYEASGAYVTSKKVHAEFGKRGIFSMYNMEDFWMDHG